MKSKRIRSSVNYLAIVGSGAFLLMTTSCGKGVENKVSTQGGEANTSAVKTGDAVVANSPSPTISELPSAGNSLPPAETGRPGTRNDSAHVSSIPHPQIGTGGSDFFLFTQARATLAADAELSATNIVIDVREGVLTLRGTVANAAQKSKAEQMVRSVAGVKAVKNQLRTSGG